MRCLLKFVVMLVALVWMNGAAGAGPFEDGLEASERGDYSAALKLWRPLADQGSASAQYKLGLMYYEGKGVVKDYAQAGKLFRRAAEQGYAGAQLQLGGMYFVGAGVAKNHTEAAKWYRRAAMQ